MQHNSFFHHHSQIKEGRCVCACARAPLRVHSSENVASTQILLSHLSLCRCTRMSIRCINIRLLDVDLAQNKRHISYQFSLFAIVDPSPCSEVDGLSAVETVVETSMIGIWERYNELSSILRDLTDQKKTSDVFVSSFLFSTWLLLFSHLNIIKIGILLVL